MYQSIVKICLVLVVCDFALADSLGSYRMYKCQSTLKDRANTESTLELVWAKLQECEDNKGPCSNYIWPQYIKNGKGDLVQSETPTVNLYELTDSLDRALWCDKAKREYPNKDSGVFVF